MSPYVFFIIISSLGLGTTITLASSHWLLAWIGLEISTLAILPLISQLHHPRAVEATTKYFLIQASATALALFSAALNAWIMGNWEIKQTFHPLIIITIIFALGLKIGLAPMHFWLPEVLQGIDLNTGLILSTWQKLAPIILIYQLSPETNQTIIILIGLTSAIIGGWGGLNQTQLRKILAYSSIAHIGWIIIILTYSPKLTILNLIIYIIITSTIFIALKTTSTTKINTLGTSWAKAPIISIIIILTILSLGGLPPTTGFIPKWLILQELTKQDLPLIATIIAISALLSLFFYIRICYTTTLTIYPNINNAKTPWQLKSTILPTPLTSITILATITLPLTPILMTIII